MLEIFWFAFIPNKHHGHELMTWGLLLFFTGIEPTDVSQLDKYKLFSSIPFQVAFCDRLPGSRISFDMDSNSSKVFTREQRFASLSVTVSFKSIIFLTETSTS